MVKCGDCGRFFRSTWMCPACKTKALKEDNQSTPVRCTFYDYNVKQTETSPPNSSGEDGLLGNAPCCGLATELKLLTSEIQAMKSEFHELKERISFLAVSSGTYNTRPDQHVGSGSGHSLSSTELEQTVADLKTDLNATDQLMNASPMGGFRRDEGGRGKRSDGRRQNTNSFMDNSKKPIENSWKSVDTSKLLQKRFSNIKLAPQMSGWNFGSGAKIATAQAVNNPVINLTKTNKHSVLENVQSDPVSLRGSKDITPSCKKKAATKRSAFRSRNGISSGGSSLSRSAGDARPNSSSRSTSGAPHSAPAPVPQDRMEDDQELYKTFNGILNKITPQKFDTLMDKVKSLEINNQKRLEGVVDLIFEKAIEAPNFSELCAAMCNKLSMLKVPADNPTTPDQCVNFRGLIISRCQYQFVTNNVDERVLTIEKEIAECTDPLEKIQLQLQLEEENRIVRMRSVGNVRFIGELYKFKMLTSKIMVYCMNYLIEKLEEEKLESLCVLLITIGEQVESEVKEQLDNVFSKMQEIVDQKSNRISDRVRFMIQDVIELKKRRWVTKSVVDSQPKTMD